MGRSPADDEKVDIYLVCGLRISGYFTVELASRTKKAIAFVPHETSFSPCDDVDMSAHLLAMGRDDVYPCRYMDDFVKAVDVLRVKKILKNLKIFFPLKNSPLTFWLPEFLSDTGGCLRKIRYPLLSYQR